MQRFSGFSQEGLRFLRDLAEHNTKEWFSPRKEVYERTVKEPMLELVRSLDDELRTLAPEYTLKDPAKAVSRIYRDVRFSADKRPFHTRLSCVFPRGGLPKQEVAGFFVSVTPAGVEVLGGAYMPGTEQLKRIRASIAADYESFLRIIRTRPLRSLLGDLQGDRLVRVPRDYPAEHPTADLLRNKQFYFRTTISPSVAKSPCLVTEITERFAAMTPFVEYLDSALRCASQPARHA